MVTACEYLLTMAGNIFRFSLPMIFIQNQDLCVIDNTGIQQTCFWLGWSNMIDW